MPELRHLSKSIGARVRARAQSLSLTQNDIAAHLEVSRDLVARLYAGRKRGLSFTQMSALCQILEIDADSLLGHNPTSRKVAEDELSDLLDEIGKLINAKIKKR